VFLWFLPAKVRKILRVCKFFRRKVKNERKKSKYYLHNSNLFRIFAAEKFSKPLCV